MNQDKPVSSKSLKVAIVTGEPSGDNLAAGLILALKDRLANVEIFGVLGPHAVKAGGRQLMSIDEICVSGISDIIKKLPRLLKAINQVALDICALKPDVVVAVDSPEFSLRVARKVRKNMPDVKIVDYICPSIWAYRPGRAKSMKLFVDKVLCILPFEPRVLKELGGPDGIFVGHALAEKVPSYQPNEKDYKVRVKPKKKILLLLGSRSGEINRHLDLFLNVAKKLDARHPGELQFVSVTLEKFSDRISQAAKNQKIDIEITTCDNAKAKVFRQAHCALVVSGTVTLELSLCETPMVAVYIPDIISQSLRFLLSTYSVLLPELILHQRFITTHLFSFEATEENVLQSMEDLIFNPTSIKKQIELLREVKSRVLDCDQLPSHKAAQTIIDIL